jgi:hypothetical protein
VKLYAGGGWLKAALLQPFISELCEISEANRTISVEIDIAAPTRLSASVLPV